MNARNEMKKALEAFGEPLTIVSNGKNSRGVGIFNKIKVTNKLSAIEKATCFYQEKYSLWVFDYSRVNKIDEIVDRSKNKFDILTGSYDKQIGCWRLVVQKKEA